jgi:1-acyl-sn-glycerol-3-phosphate acyltransferase
MWQPRSTCHDGCLPRPGADPRAALPVVVARLVGVVVVLLTAAVVLPLAPSAAVPRTVRRLARAILYTTGVRHIARGPLPRGAALVVANHSSWLDICVLLAHWPVRLLAKTEVGGWPVVGRLARASGALFIDRSRPRSLPGTVAEVTAALRSGAVVAVFPEGTTWCGRAGGRFRPALFQAAADAGVAVSPTRLTFTRADGTPTTVAAFVGDDPLTRSVLRVVRARGLTVTAQALPTLYPAPGERRTCLAATADATVHGAARHAGHSTQLNDRSTALRHSA